MSIMNFAMPFQEVMMLMEDSNKETGKEKD